MLVDHNKSQVETNNKNSLDIPKYLGIKQPPTKKFIDQIREELKLKITKIFELNENEDTIYQNVWDLVKAVLKYIYI